MKEKDLFIRKGLFIKTENCFLNIKHIRMFKIVEIEIARAIKGQFDLTCYDYKNQMYIITSNTFDVCRKVLNLLIDTLEINNLNFIEGCYNDLHNLDFIEKLEITEYYGTYSVISKGHIKDIEILHVLIKGTIEDCHKYLSNIDIEKF